LNHYRRDCAAAIDGTMPNGLGQPRSEIIRRYKEGKIQFLVKYGIATEGFDAPNTAFVVMGRPTKSLLVSTQMLGRCTRPLPNIVDGLPTAEERKDAIKVSAKPYATVLDFVGNSKIQVVTATDVLGGNYDVDVRNAADEIIGARGTGNALDALAKARASLLLEAEEARRRPIRNAVQATHLNYHLRDVDAFGPAPSRTSPRIRRGGATDAQIAVLVNLGVEQERAAGYSKKQAGVVIDKLRAQRCTIRQANTLRKFGFNPDKFNAQTASEQIQKIADSGWRFPPQEMAS
jgi:hypothetical protein